MQSSKINYQSEDAWVSDLDPIMEGGYKVAFFQPHFPIQVRRNINNNEVESSKQIMQIRIMILHASEVLADIKIQLRSQQNVYSVYLSNIDEKRFQKIKKAQQLNFSYSNMLQMLVKQINLCQKEMNNYSCVLLLNKISNHRLDILQNLEYKRINLLSLDFRELDQEEIKNYVIYRFTKIKMNKQIISKKLKDVFSLLKIKNPQLLNELEKKHKESSKTSIYKSY